MSIYLYLRCEAHDPPLRSEEEVAQHWTGLDAIRTLVERNRAIPVGERVLLTEQMVTAIVEARERPSDYFEANALTFLLQHPTCPLAFVSEYGEVEAL